MFKLEIGNLYHIKNEINYLIYVHEKYWELSKSYELKPKVMFLTLEYFFPISPYTFCYKILIEDKIFYCYGITLKHVTEIK